jgi:hypothetical protein
VLPGCGGLSREQAQHLSDSLAGIAVVQPRIAADPVATDALTGAADHIEAAAVGTALPAPERLPAAIAADPAGYRADAQERAERAQAVASAGATGATDGATSGGSWWGWAVGALGATLGVARFIPGPGGALADLAWRALAPRAHRQADETRDVHAQGFQDLVGALRAMAPDQPVSAFQARIAQQAAPETRAAMVRLPAAAALSAAAAAAAAAPAAAPAGAQRT